MGLAASQARYLLLTARRSDLEYRAQMISQRKIALAMETEQVATAYTKALNNRHLMFTYWVSPNEGGTPKETTAELTYEAFTTLAPVGKAGYRLVDAASGKIVCLDLAEAEKYVSKEDYTNAEGIVDEAGYNAAVAKQKENMMVVPGLKNKDYLQDLIQTGALGIEQSQTKVIDVESEEKDAEGNPVIIQKNVIEWSPVVFAGMDDVSSELYTDDDSAAMAEYETKSLLIQTQDKQLDVELKQIETQLEACKAEQESVGKLVKDRAGNDFKLFG